jgi:hypothetical protein
MENKTILQKDDTDKMKPGIISIEKKDTGNTLPEKVPEKKQRKRVKISPVLQAAAMARRALDAVDAHSSKYLKGSSRPANTGTIISYD